MVRSAATTTMRSVACSTSARKRRSLAASRSWAACCSVTSSTCWMMRSVLPRGVEHRTVGRRPPALLEPRGALHRDVVALDRHRVRLAAIADPLQRGAQLLGSVGGGVVGVVGEGLEDVLADQLVALPHRRPLVGLVGLADDEVLRQDEQRHGRGAHDRRVVDAPHVCRRRAPVPSVPTGGIEYPARAARDAGGVSARAPLQPGAAAKRGWACSRYQVKARRHGRARPMTASSAVRARGGSAGTRRWSRSAVRKAGACAAEKAP